MDIDFIFADERTSASPLEKLQIFADKLEVNCKLFTTNCVAVTDNPTVFTLSEVYSMIQDHTIEAVQTA